jgi:hypothetical protein
MSNTITLPSGATVTLRDPKSLKHKDRKTIYVDGDLTTRTSIDMMERIIAVMVQDWSYDLLIPSVKLDSLGELDIPDYDALQDKVQDLLPSMFPQLARTDEGEANPKATGENSND